MLIVVHNSLQLIFIACGVEGAGDLKGTIGCCEISPFLGHAKTLQAYISCGSEGFLLSSLPPPLNFRVLGYLSL